jgi:hypothetical protein
MLYVFLQIFIEIYHNVTTQDDVKFIEWLICREIVGREGNVVCQKMWDYDLVILGCCVNSTAAQKPFFM